MELDADPRFMIYADPNHWFERKVTLSWELPLSDLGRLDQVVRGAPHSVAGTFQPKQQNISSHSPKGCLFDLVTAHT